MFRKVKIFLVFTLYVEAFAFRFLRKYVESKKYKFSLLVELMRAVHRRPKNLQITSVYDHNCLLTRGVSTLFLLEHFRLVTVSTDAKTFFNNVFGRNTAVHAPPNYSDYPDLLIPEITATIVNLEKIPQGTILLLLPHQVKQTIGQTSFTKINKYFYEIQINESAGLLAASTGDESDTV